MNWNRAETRRQSSQVEEPRVPHAPSNFVDLPKDVWSPDANQPDHDLPHTDGLSAVLTVELQTHSPLMVGGARENQSVKFFRQGDRQAIPGSSLKGMIRSALENAAFGRMKMVDDRRFGLRDLTSAAADIYRRMMVETRQHATMSRPVARALPRAGWLTFNQMAEGGAAWTITECDVLRIEWDLIRYLLKVRFFDPNISYSEDVLKGKRTGGARRELFVNPTDGLQKGSTAISVLGDELPRVVKSSGAVDLEMRMVRLADERDIPPPPRDTWKRGEVFVGGWLVFTGHPDAKKLDKETGQKRLVRHREFVFTEPAVNARRIVVPANVWHDFLLLQAKDGDKGQNASDRSAWAYWSTLLRDGRIGPDKKFADGSPAEPGVPVFWLSGENRGGSADDIASLGLAQMFKVAYPLSTHDLIRAHNPDLLSQGASVAPDLPELLFGTAAERGDGLKGRVTFGLGCIDAGDHSSGDPIKLILSSPKPSYFPLYVKQTMNDAGFLSAPWRSYLRDNAGIPELRGRKRYPSQSVGTWKAADQAIRDAEATNIGPGGKRGNPEKQVTTLLDPAPAGSRFTFTIRCHNLRPFELGALAWALGFGEDPTSDHAARRYRHALGMGKAHGLGAITLRITDVDITHNRLNPDQSERHESGKDGVAAAVASMDDFTSMIACWKADWASSPQINQLLAMATPRSPNAEPKLAYMRLDMVAKINDFVAVKSRTNGRRTLPDPTWHGG